MMTLLRPPFSVAPVTRYKMLLTTGRAAPPARAVHRRAVLHRRAACSAAAPEDARWRADAPQTPPLPVGLGGGARQFLLGQRTPVQPEAEVDGFCRACRPRLGLVTCADCEGGGVLSRAGYARSNPVSLNRIVGSKWTAMERTFGWRHYRAVSCKREGTASFVELVSTCDPSVRFFVNSANLKDRSRWLCGWLEREELRAPEAAGGGSCRACSGSGSVKCPGCAGKVVNI